MQWLYFNTMNRQSFLHEIITQVAKQLLKAKKREILSLGKPSLGSRSILTGTSKTQQFRTTWKGSAFEWSIDTLTSGEKPLEAETGTSKGSQLSVQRREPTTSTHIWRRIWESNPGHIGGRRVLSPLRHLCKWLVEWLSFVWGLLWMMHWFYTELTLTLG